MYELFIGYGTFRLNPFRQRTFCRSHLQRLFHRRTFQIGHSAEVLAIDILSLKIRYPISINKYKLYIKINVINNVFSNKVFVNIKYGYFGKI